jgi:predicted transcriptional regulator
MTKKRLASNVLPQSLGELELAVLQVLWQSPNLSARGIADKLRPRRAVSLSTVQSSLENLRKKNLLEYRKQRQAFVYAAKVSRSDLLGRFVSDIIQTLHDGKLDTILSSFVYVASNINDDALDDLDRLIQEKRRQQQAAKESK